MATPDACTGLRNTDGGLPLAPDDGALDSNSHRPEIQVLPAQLTHLSPAGAAPAGNQDERPVLIGHVLHDHRDLLRRCRLGLRPTDRLDFVGGLARAFSDQRVSASRGGTHDGGQKRVRMRSAGRGVGQQVGLELVHIVGGDLADPHGTERGQDLLLEQHPTEGERPRLQRLAAADAPSHEPVHAALRQGRGHCLRGRRRRLTPVFHDLGLAMANLWSAFSFARKVTGPLWRRPSGSR